MPATHRRGVIPRRRRDDDGEDESSTIGEDDFSLSEGSAVSNIDDDADVEGSEVSGEAEETRPSIPDIKTAVPIPRGKTAPVADTKSDVETEGTLQDNTGITINGTHQPRSGTSTEVGKVKAAIISNRVANQASSSAPQLVSPQEPLAERSRKDHLEYVRQRDSNPAFVPNRGGFFLHDDRSSTQSSAFGRPFARGRGRGYGPGYSTGRGYGQTVTGPTEQQWAHDLHETVNKTAASPVARETAADLPIPTAKPAPSAPNRAFSVSTVLGNVTVQVALPGMERRTIFQNLVKKQHTLLPQHRPPLRRDKPVRISIPDTDPRFIFPSTERSFIFIPRAMRPNQQAYTRGRGRGSFHGSRRPSVMGSVYTPSIAMSRRSSFGGAASTGVHTPTDGPILRGPFVQPFNRPVVRMPIAHFPAPNMVPVPMASILPAGSHPQPRDYNNPGPTILHSPTVALPMHQPRPQKTISVTEIEPPAVKAPLQQQEQPFHQQMPPGVSLADGPIQQGQSQHGINLNAPLSHIPEGAIYAQPFQPYPVYPPNGYYGPAYPGGPMLYHAPVDAYAMGMGGPVLPQQFASGQNFMAVSQASETGSQQGAMMHESNGMVYYFDPSQYAADGSQMAQYPLTIGGNAIMSLPASGPYYYSPMPGGMFYPST